VLGVVKKKKAG